MGFVKAKTGIQTLIRVMVSSAKRALLPLVTTLLMLAVPRTSAHAFCGFYVSTADGKLSNDATQVVLMRDGTHTVLAMQNDYRGPPEDFALVVFVPVRTLAKNPRAVVTEYAWGAESCDPCPTLVQGLSKTDIASLGADVIPGLMTTSTSPYPTTTTPLPRIRDGAITVTGKLDPNAVRNAVRKEGYSLIRTCYEAGEKKNPSLEGRVTVKIDIDGNGNVTSARNAGSELPDPDVVACVVKVFGGIVSFPATADGKRASVVYP